MSRPIPTMRVGDLVVHVLSDGFFRLDGGAMFGIVPKTLWEKKIPADEKNRITLGLNCMLVTLPDGRRVLCDTGMGERWSEKERAIYGIDRTETLDGSLRTLGLTQADIDVVINSHLHFDHAGGNTVATPDGRIVPTFPNATYVSQEREWTEANAPHERHRASYRPDDFLPVVAEGQLRLARGTEEILPGVFVDHCPGHCPGHQVVRLESKGATLVFAGDLMPTAAHVRPAWNMGYDLDAAAVVNGKRALLDKIVEGGWTICFDHDPTTPLVRIRREVRDGREDYVTVPVGDSVS